MPLMSKHYSTFQQKQQVFYDSFDNEVGNDERDNILCCGKTCFIVMFLLLFAVSMTFNGIAIKIANDNTNATCFQQAKIMSLSNYVLISASVSIVLDIISFIAIIVCISAFNLNDLFFLLTLGPVIILIILYSIYALAMAIIGTIELANSYPLCNNEINLLCIITIISVIFRFLGLCSGSLKVKM